MDLDRKLAQILSQLNVGVFIVDRSFVIEYWNHFMETHSGISAEAAAGRCLFELIADLPVEWFRRKSAVAFTLKQSAFSGWEQRPNVFGFKNVQRLTLDVQDMRQDCMFIPIKEESTGDINSICVVVTDVTERSVAQTLLKDALAKLEESSVRDSLTGVYNRHHAQQVLDVEFQKYRRYGFPLSLAMVDLDHFKRINDTYGHLAGDDVLREVANALTNRLRATDVVSRYGGEEFLILFPGIDQGQAICAAEAVRQTVESLSIDLKSETIRATVSVGTCQADERHPSSAALLADADTALYASKHAGRNRVTAWSKDLVSQ
ncbi:MAG: diguanylate cyclase [Deltaproteobacteria bacterium]|nr:diguanylate cyclase [Deltaproteobacteria bacterium]